MHRQLRHMLLTGLLGSGLAVAAPLASAEASDASAHAQGQYHTWTNAAGNTVEVYRKRGENAAGTHARARGYRVTDADGELVRSGRDRAFVREDGSGARVHARNHVRPDGALVQSRARVRRDADGNVSRVRGKRVTQ